MCTYVGPLDIHVISPQISRHPEVSDFTSQSFTNQHIPRGQISVNELRMNTS